MTSFRERNHPPSHILAHPSFLTLNSGNHSRICHFSSGKIFSYNSHFPNLLDKWPVTHVANYDEKWLGTHMDMRACLESYIKEKRIADMNKNFQFPCLLVLPAAHKYRTSFLISTQTWLLNLSQNGIFKWQNTPFQKDKTLFSIIHAKIVSWWQIVRCSAAIIRCCLKIQILNDRIHKQ